MPVLFLISACAGDIGLPAGPDQQDRRASSSESGVDPDSLAGSAIGDELAAHCDSAIEPGRVLLHRLNRIELGYTLSDLTGLDQPWGQDAPADESAAGFDNQASALAMSPLHVEKYFDTAKVVAAALLSNPEARKRAVGDLKASSSKSKVSEAIGDFAARAFRRPVTRAEVARLVALHETARDEGADFDAALSLPLRAILGSPHFVFHAPVLADANGKTRALDPHAVASRLSYFLWSSLPDTALKTAADDGKLETAAQLEVQVKRMLLDKKAERFVRAFAGQWLDLRALGEAKPDPTLFPSFTAPLRTAMQDESYALFRDLLVEGTDVRDLLVGGYSTLTRELAEHYGLEATGFGASAQRVSLEGSQRIGFLTQGSFLTLTSHPQRTSLVKRGKWVLEQLLCAPPPPPPPGVEALPVDKPGKDQGESLRDMIEAHREDPACAGCHASMDPIGFGLEHFDPVGAYRTEDRGFTIDASGELPAADRSLQHFEGARELSHLVAKDPRLPACIADKIFTFALARAPTSADECTLAALESRLSSGDYSLLDLVVSTAQVPAFTHATPEIIKE